jgi:endonuclease-3 related protein
METMDKGRLLDLYRRLYGYFGHRHWWPADTPFEMIVGAILTQNVSWKSAAAAIAQLQAADLLSITGIFSLPGEQLAAYLRPARYHWQKAKKLQAFCRLVEESFGGELERLLALPTAELRPLLLSVYGIGPETADAIILYAAAQPVFVIDAYTVRIFGRLGLTGETGYDRLQQLVQRHLPPDLPLYNDFHAQIDALGNQICLKSRPRCVACPLAEICPAGQQNLKRV